MSGAISSQMAGPNAGRTPGSSLLRGVVTGALLLVCLSFFAACTKTGKSSSEQEKHYTMAGVVLGLDPKLQTANIKHGPITGWMEAMTMEYPVRSKTEFEQLHVGDHITATVNVRGTDYDISSIHKQTAPAAPPAAH